MKKHSNARYYTFLSSGSFVAASVFYLQFIHNSSASGMEQVMLFFIFFAYLTLFTALGTSIFESIVYFTKTHHFS
ncbi:hypothetical protein H6501_02570 [Candidatus Woesearchaeota archaeon]|nr:hypothetical protein [Nanoarchaeota archaeon]MCB9370455.1 hypothetical protein [Candidatus Woesearchaeota archaeon]USN43533.1 MAG: hypothetical protein H6500_04010 [Candidatus Woesearchaeota archaeon]